MNKLISTFLFSEPYESEVLLCKLASEYCCIDEFIGIQSAYTTRGIYKGTFLEEVLSRKDFSPYRDKVTILTNENSFYPNEEYSEKNNLLSEFTARAYCWQYIQDKYDDDDWILCEDSDELLDFSNVKRRDILLNLFNKYNESIQILNQRMWWDFCNLAPSYEKYIPCHKVGFMKSLENPFYHRNQHCKMIKLDIVIAFENCHCFDKIGNSRKVGSAAHDKYTEEVMENAYRYNTFHKSPHRGESLQYPLDFFETVELTEENSPKFVLENIDKLKVNTIDPNYAENRVRDFGIYPHPCEQMGLMMGNKIDRKSHYYRRSK